LASELCLHAIRQGGIESDEHRHGIGIMLRLREQVCGDPGRIGVSSASIVSSEGPPSRSIATALETSCFAAVT